MSIRCWALNLDKEGLWAIDGVIRIFVKKSIAKRAQSIMADPKRVSVVKVHILSDVNKIRESR